MTFPAIEKKPSLLMFDYRTVAIVEHVDHEPLAFTFGTADVQLSQRADAQGYHPKHGRIEEQGFAPCFHPAICAVRHA